MNAFGWKSLLCFSSSLALLGEYVHGDPSKKGPCNPPRTVQEPCEPATIAVWAADLPAVSCAMDDAAGLTAMPHVT
jgi:hypothetical protein